MTDIVDEKRVSWTVALGPNERTRLTVGSGVVDLDGWDRFAQAPGRLFMWRDEAEQLAVAILRLLGKPTETL